VAGALQHPRLVLFQAPPPPVQLRPGDPSNFDEWQHLLLHQHFSHPQPKDIFVSSTASVMARRTVGGSAAHPPNEASMEEEDNILHES
jgi:hypothetical protein